MKNKQEGEKRMEDLESKSEEMLTFLRGHMDIIYKDAEEKGHHPAVTIGGLLAMLAADTVTIAPDLKRAQELLQKAVSGGYEAGCRALQGK